MKRYVPDLIPPNHKVLPDYFTSTAASATADSNPLLDFLRKGLVVMLLIVALLVIGVHPGFSASLAVLAFFLSRRGRQKLEQGLRFQFTPSLRAASLSALSLVSVATSLQYKQRLDDAAAISRQIALAEQKAKAEQSRKAKLRLDSLHTYLREADAFMNKGSYKQAIALYKESARFASSNEPSEQERLHTGLANGYVRTKQYRLAIDEFDWLGELDNEQLYQRALCYQQVGKKAEALADLSKSSAAGYKPATKLYDKLNPLVKKLLYYQTVCCDGSYSPSNAKGRGACSHHGGVCNWNLPIYETYRKYNDNGFPN